MKSPGALAQWQSATRKKMIELLGGFPARTPLNARTVRRFDAQTYWVENITFESVPGFTVTANLYLPKGNAPFPVVLVPCGHSENGKAAESYQRVCIQLVGNGIAAFCYDPIGQGERKQILEVNQSGQALSKGKFRSTTEHSLVGVKSILLGSGLATRRIWDGMRALDYLESRDEIDASRMGCTGNSGGGLMTSYLVATDTRIQAAAPGCFVTTTEIKNVTPGPGDAEQNIFGQIAAHIDHSDYLQMAAPRAVLICAATDDFVPVNGTWTAFREAKRFYTQMGVPERVSLVEANEKHGFTRPLRLATVRWMKRWLQGSEEPLHDMLDWPVHSEADLRCTPKGQVLLLPKQKSIFDLDRDRARQLLQSRHERSHTLSSEALRKLIQQTIGLRDTKQSVSAADRCRANV